MSAHSPRRVPPPDPLTEQLSRVADQLAEQTALLRRISQQLDRIGATPPPTATASSPLPPVPGAGPPAPGPDAGRPAPGPGATAPPRRPPAPQVVTPPIDPEHPVRGVPRPPVRPGAGGQR